MAAALASAWAGVPPPQDSAFVGEIGLTGQVRAASGMAQRVGAARAAGRTTVFARAGPGPVDGVRVVPVRHVRDALGWATARAVRPARKRTA